MQLYTTKDRKLQVVSQELRTQKQGLKTTKRRIRSWKSEKTDPRAYLSEQDVKKWEKLSPRRKERIIKRASMQTDRISKDLTEDYVLVTQTQRKLRSKEHFHSEHQRFAVPDSGTAVVHNRLKTDKERKYKVGANFHKKSVKKVSMENGASEILPPGVKESVRMVTGTARRAAQRFTNEVGMERAKEEAVQNEIYRRKEEVLPNTVGQSSSIREKLEDFVVLRQVLILLWNFVTSIAGFLLMLITALLPILLSVFLLVIIVTSIFSGGASVTAKYDGACYLSAKYESHGDCGAIGSGGMGEYGFDKAYSLQSFVRYCYEKDPATYEEFAAYQNVSGAVMYSSTQFRAVWKSLAQQQKVAFEGDQTIYTYEHYFLPAANLYTKRYGYNFLEAPDAVKACVTSFSIRDGAESAAAYFVGTTANSTPEEIIKNAYRRMQAKRPLGTVSGPRWVDEGQDCLEILSGTLDIYEPDTSPSGYGGIDWSWKRGKEGSGNGEIADLALSAVGCAYDQGRRDEPGIYDCSSLVYRLYAQIGITYLSGMTAANEAQYLESHGMSVSESDLQPGDLIFYSYSKNGRYKNISHVAIYIGDGQKVHAKGRAYGVVCDAYSPSNIGVYCRPQ